MKISHLHAVRRYMKIMAILCITSSHSCTTLHDRQRAIEKENLIREYQAAINILNESGSGILPDDLPKNPILFRNYNKLSLKNQNELLRYQEGIPPSSQMFALKEYIRQTEGEYTLVRQSADIPKMPTRIILSVRQSTNRLKNEFVVTLNSLRSSKPNVKIVSIDDSKPSILLATLRYPGRTVRGFISDTVWEEQATLMVEVAMQTNNCSSVSITGYSEEREEPYTTWETCESREIPDLLLLIRTNLLTKGGQSNECQ